MTTALLFMVFMAQAAWGPARVSASPYGPVTLVNPMVGTANGGNTFPGAVVPWGMVSVSPENDSQAPSGYVSGRPFIYGFGHTHLSGAGTPALGNVVLMPTTGPVSVSLKSRASAYDSEKAFPGYYKTRLTRYGLLAEMTAACRVGMSRYTFPACDGDANILVDAGARLATDEDRSRYPTQAEIRIISPQEVEGMSESGGFGQADAREPRKIYFAAQFSKAAKTTGTWENGKLSSEPTQTGEDVGAVFRFSTADGESVEVKVGLSYVSLANARLNLQTEMPGWDFETVMRAALKVWDAQLSKIKVSGGDPIARKIFYTALYHCLLEPSVFNDVNGEYQGFARSGIKVAKNYTRYSFFSLPFTQRALHPLLALVYPQVELDMTKSLVEMGKEGPLLPRWEAAGEETGQGVGMPAVVVLADTYLKGLTDFDVSAAMTEVGKIIASKSDGPYAGLQDFLSQGYVPQAVPGKDAGRYPVVGSVSASLEYSQGFWALSQWARALGQDALAKACLARIGAFRNLYDPKTHFLRPRNPDGTFLEPFDPKADCCDQPWPGSGGPGFYEGTAWQYLFDAPQDLEGLKLLLGGDAGFVRTLEKNFSEGDYDPGNSADMDDPYLFDAVPGDQWETQKYVRLFLSRDYGPNADGLPGHDESGNLSAWYVFSAMGFYPVAPASLIYR
ncbi:MAG: GH92 family glycosyl hydrolase, partial [bacterium]